MDLHLRGKRVLITGASKGIGAAAAEAFAEEGAHVMLAARSGDQLKALADRLRSAHQIDATTHVVDLRNPADLAKLAKDAADIDMSKVVYLEGPAGSITIHNCRTLHYSKANWSEIPRPLLLNVYSAADAMPYTANPLPSKYSGAIVRGKPARWAYHDPRPCMLPPDWSGGYTSIFALQQQEEWAKQPRKAAGGMM